MAKVFLSAFNSFAFGLFAFAVCINAFAESASPSGESQAKRAAVDARGVLDRNIKAHPSGLAMSVRPSRHVEGSMVFAVGASKMAAEEWLVYMPLPPETLGQKNVSYKATPEVKKTAEAGGLKQGLLMWDISAGKANRNMVAVNITYSADLLAHKLVAGKGEAVAGLGDEERGIYLAATSLLDWREGAFQEFLAANKLRPLDVETDVDLARRIFLYFKEHSNFEFKEGIERRVSRTCSTMKTDCGGLTALYVAALRANGIPARQLVGRWAQSAKKGETLYGKPWQQEHIKAEFYASGIGWVPVDVSVAVDFDKKPGSLQHFGDDPGNFLTFHFDADLAVEVPKLGRQVTRFMQEPAYFFLGKGSLEGEVRQSDWVVESSARGRRQ